jgi:DNA-binding helix-turn-helix protein
MEKAKKLSWSVRVKIAMLERNMTVAELAKKIGRSRPYVSLVVSGKLIAPPTNRMISDVLNVSWTEDDYRG